MRFKIQVVIEEDDQQIAVEDIVSFEKGFSHSDCIGLSLSDSKQVLKNLQRVMIQAQAQAFVNGNRQCPCCDKNRRVKGYHTIQYRTLFGIVTIDSPRYYHCPCDETSKGTFSLLTLVTRAF